MDVGRKRGWKWEMKVIVCNSTDAVLFIPHPLDVNDKHGVDCIRLTVLSSERSLGCQGSHVFVLTQGAGRVCALLSDWRVGQRAGKRDGAATFH